MRALGRWERFTLLKLLTGELRVGVSQTLVVRALAQAAALPATSVAARLMGDWTPTAAWYAALVSPGATDDGPLAAVSVLPRLAHRARVAGAPTWPGC